MAYNWYFIFLEGKICIKEESNWAEKPPEQGDNWSGRLTEMPTQTTKKLKEKIGEPTNKH